MSSFLFILNNHLTGNATPKITLPSEKILQNSSSQKIGSPPEIPDIK
jgi:hypothetical protein